MRPLLGGSWRLHRHNHIPGYQDAPLALMPALMPALMNSSPNA